MQTLLPQPSYGSNTTVVVQLSACLPTELQKIIQTQHTPRLDGTLDTSSKHMPSTTVS